MTLILLAAPGGAYEQATASSNIQNVPETRLDDLVVQGQPEHDERLDLLELAERYCLEPDGDHELTWAIAAHDGYTAFTRDDFQGLRTPGARQVRGYSKTRDGVEIRVLTSVKRQWEGPGFTGAIANLHLCWVSANPLPRREVDEATQEFLGRARFRIKDAWVHAWLPQPDGTRLPVGRSDFERQWVLLYRDKGMRSVLTGDYAGWSSITYMRPVEGCADWCYDGR